MKFLATKIDLGIITIVHQPAGRQWAKFFAPTVEYTLVYAKDKTQAKFNKIALSADKIEEFHQEDEKGKYLYKSFIRNSKTPDKDPKHWYPIYVHPENHAISLNEKQGYHAVYPEINNRKMGWLQTKTTASQQLKTGRLELEANRSGDNQLHIVRKYREQEVLYTHWQYWEGKKYINQIKGTQYLRKTLERHSPKTKAKVSYPKSYETIMDFIKITTNKNDLVLDFFAGSGTTGEAVWRVNQQDRGNRKFILIEQLEEHITACKIRLQGYLKDHGLNYSLTYFELAKFNQKAKRAD